MDERLKKETKAKLDKWQYYRNSIYRWGKEGTPTEGFILGINPDYDYEEEINLQKEYQKSLQELIKNNK